MLEMYVVKNERRKNESLRLEYGQPWDQQIKP